MHSIWMFLAVFVPLLILPLLVSMVDFITVLRSRLKKIHVPAQAPTTGEDFSLLIPIFGDLKYLKNVEFLAPYGRKVILCTTNKESAEFNEELARLAKQHHFRVFRSAVRLAASKQKPNPWRLFHRTLQSKSPLYSMADARDEIIRDSFASIRTPYCIFLDGDTVAETNLDVVVHTMRERNYDIASVRVLPSQEVTLMEKLQYLEYALSMDARKMYPWLTSGACMVAKTEVIKEIMLHHSLFFSGGDIEIGKLAMMLHYKVGHLPYVFFTDVPDTFKAWVKQRMAWCGGGFRHAIVNGHQYSWRHPFFLLYTTVIVYGLTPVRWYEVLNHLVVLPLVIGLYWALIFTFHWRTRRLYYFWFPFYALFQVMVIVPLGIYTYFKMVYQSGNVGIIRLRERLEPEGQQPVARRMRFTLDGVTHVARASELPGTLVAQPVAVVADERE